jgi:hypothetical protein
MVRIFGLIVALAALMTPASAALLGQYEFTGGSLSATSVDSGFAGSGGGFSSFNAAGTLTGTAVNDRYEFGVPASASGILNGASTNPYVGFSITNTGPGYTITSLSFNFRQLLPSGDTDGGSMRAYYRFGAGAWATYGNATGYSLDALSTLTQAINLSVPDATTVEFAFRVQNIAGLDQTMFVDNVMVGSSVVPEPASMAIFGTLAGFGLVRRLRRK